MAMPNVSVHEQEIAWEDFATVKAHKKQLQKHSKKKEMSAATRARICLKFFSRLIDPRSEIMNKNEKFTVETCPKNDKEVDVYMTDEDGIDRMVHCGNHKIERGCLGIE